MKKVLVITRWFPNKNEPVRCVFVKNILDALAKHTKCSYKLISPVPYFPKVHLPFISEKIKEYSGLDYEENAIGYKIYRPKYFKLPSPLFKDFEWYLYFKAVLSTIKNMRVSFDLIHSHGLYPDSYVAIKAGEYFNIPVVVHAHDSYFMKIFQEHGDKINHIMMNAKKIIAVSEFQKKVITNLFPHCANKIMVVYNGVDTDKFNFSHCRANDKLKLCFIGNLLETKGVDILIKAISLLKNDISISADIFGSGKNEKKYHLMANILGIANIVNFKGAVNNGVIAKCLKDYSFLILPSYYETFGIVLIEAMACGVPVVATKVGAIPEIVSSDELGILVEPGNPQALAEGVKKAFSKRWDGRKIREHAKNFSIDKTANNIGMIYDEVLNTKERNVNV